MANLLTIVYEVMTMKKMWAVETKDEITWCSTDFHEHWRIKNKGLKRLSLYLFPSWHRTLRFTGRCNIWRAIYLYLYLLFTQKFYKVRIRRQEYRWYEKR